MIIITILLLLILVVLVYNYYVHHNRNGRFINLIPGIPGFPIIGTIPLYRCSREEYWRLLMTVFDYYYIFKIWLFFTPYVLIRHPDDFKTILNSAKHIEKTRVYCGLHLFEGDGLSTSGGAKWHTRRNILTPIFHFNILPQFVEIFIEESASMTKSLKDIGGTVVKDLVPFISEYTLNATYEITMGTSLKDLGVFQQWLQKTIIQLHELSINRTLKPWLHNNWIFSLTSKGRERTNILKILNEVTKQIIADRKRYHERTNGRYLKNFADTSTEISKTETIGILRKRLSMLDFLIAASQEGLMTTDLDIKEELDSLIFMGLDNTTMGTSYLLALLAEHKDIQDRVRNEIDTALRENGEKFTVKLLQDLSYLDRCLKESLRLYSGQSLMLRIAGEDIKLQSYLVPAGTRVFLNIHKAHRDPNFWPNPEVFDPDRFLSEKILNHHPYAYLPFSAEPRNCIGQELAMLEMKAMVAPLIHNFYVEPVDYLKNLRILIDMVLRPADPFRVRFIPIYKN